MRDFEMVSKRVNKQLLLLVFFVLNTSALICQIELGVLEHFEWNISYDRKDHEKIIPLMKECGITWVRQEFRFRNENLTDTLYTENYLRRCDTLMQFYKKDSISVLILFTADSARLIAEGFANEGDKSRISKAFLAFVNNLVNKYKQQTLYFEILNEPNSRMPAELYSVLLKKVSVIIKESDPKAVIVYGGLDIVPQNLIQSGEIIKWGWSRYLEQTERLGCGKYYDYFSFHPFVFPRSPHEGGLLNTINLAAKLSGKKIWITEFGYPTGEGDKRVTEENQAQYLANAFTISAETGVVEKFFLANGFRDGIGGPMTSIWSNTGVVRKDFSPKPSFFEIKKYTQNINEGLN